MSNIPVTRTYLPKREAIDAYIDGIYQTGWVTNYGLLTQELERRLEEYLGVPNVVLVSNGTAALQVAYHLFNVKGTVLTTPFSFIASASSIQWHGADLHFGDIDRLTLNLDPQSVNDYEAEIDAVVPVHVYGNPCDCSSFDQLAEERDFRLIYDASHAFGINGPEGSILDWGDVSTLSFHATKVFHTIEGGALVLKDDELAEKARHMINFGFDEGEIKMLGINAKMNEFEAAMGLAMLDEIEGVLAARKAVADYYDANISRNLERPIRSEAYTSNYSYYPVIFDSETQLLAANRRLEEAEISARRYFYPSLDTLDFLNPVSDSISQDIAARVLCLPLFAGLENATLESVVLCVNAET